MERNDFWDASLARGGEQEQMDKGGDRYPKADRLAKGTPPS